MSRLVFTENGPGTEWCGAVGFFVASMLARLLGRVGGSIVLFAGMLITAVLAVDLDLHQTIERIKEWALRFWDWIGRKREGWEEYRAQVAASRTAEEALEASDEPEEAPAKAPVRITKPPLEEPAAEPVAIGEVAPRVAGERDHGQASDEDRAEGHPGRR